MTYFGMKTKNLMENQGPKIVSIVIENDRISHFCEKCDKNYHFLEFCHGFQNRLFLYCLRMIFYICFLLFDKK